MINLESNFYITIALLYHHCITIVSKSAANPSRSIDKFDMPLSIRPYDKVTVCILKVTSGLTSSIFHSEPNKVRWRIGDTIQLK
jgi:hypothetical protein